MHNHRAQALLGVVIGVTGLFLKAASSDGEGFMATLAQQVPDFPDGIPTVWGGLDTWAQVVLVILIVVVVAIALRPLRAEALDRMSSIALVVIGVVLFIYAIVKWIDASNSASDLTDGFAQVAAAGAIPQAFTASVNPIGFILLLIGTAIVAAAGAMAMMKARTAA